VERLETVEGIVEKWEMLPDPLDRAVHVMVADSLEAAARGESPHAARSSGPSAAGYLAASVAEYDERACYEDD